MDTSGFLQGMESLDFGDYPGMADVAYWNYQSDTQIENFLNMNVRSGGPSSRLSMPPSGLRPALQALSQSGYNAAGRSFSSHDPSGMSVAYDNDIAAGLRSQSFGRDVDFQLFPTPPVGLSQEATSGPNTRDEGTGPVRCHAFVSDYNSTGCIDPRQLQLSPHHMISLSNSEPMQAGINSAATYDRVLERDENSLLDLDPKLDLSVAAHFSPSANINAMPTTNDLNDGQSNFRMIEAGKYLDADASTADSYTQLSISNNIPPTYDDNPSQPCIVLSQAGSISPPSSQSQVTQETTITQSTPPTSISSARRSSPRVRDSSNIAKGSVSPSARVTKAPAGRTTSVAKQKGRRGCPNKSPRPNANEWYKQEYKILGPSVRLTKMIMDDNHQEAASVVFFREDDQDRLNFELRIKNLMGFNIIPPNAGLGLEWRAFEELLKRTGHELGCECEICRYRPPRYTQYLKNHLPNNLYERIMEDSKKQAKEHKTMLLQHQVRSLRRAWEDAEDESRNNAALEGQGPGSIPTNAFG